MLHPEYALFMDRLEQGLSKGADLSKLPEWICTNTRHPRNPSFRWNFKGHEFQIGIVSEAAHHVVVKKCSQVGLSEVSIRMALGLGFMRDMTGIYCLPTTPFAKRFSQHRINTIVDASPMLRERKNPSTYSAELKRIGGLTLYVTGASSDSSAISVPAQFLFRDEYDFGDPEVLTKMGSRLGHSKEDDSFKRDFSTPTVAGYGIDEKFKPGSQAWYGVKHDRCGRWVTPKFLDDVYIPGLDIVARDFQKYQRDAPGVKDAFVRCPDCNHPISVANLADPDKRMWIFAYPDREIKSFQVQPFDVVDINPPARTLREIGDYKLRADWVNFKVGDIYEDASNSFNPTFIDMYMSNHCLTIRENEPQSTGAVMGVDVGAISWIVIAKKMGNVLQVIHLESVQCKGFDDALFKRVSFLMRNLHIGFGIIDSMPDFNTAGKLCREFPGKFLACEYAESLPIEIDTLMVKEDKVTVRAHRNKRFDLLVEDYSYGAIRWCPTPEMEILKEHVQGMKKTRRASEEMESFENLVETWQKTGEDHYLHALNYAHIAAAVCGTLKQEDLPPCLPMPGKVRIGPEPKAKAQNNPGKRSSILSLR